MYTCADMSIPIIYSKTGKHSPDWSTKPLEPLDFSYYWTLVNWICPFVTHPLHSPIPRGGP